MDEGCVDILVGLGGTATNDGGMGILAALGARFLDEEGRELGPGGGEPLRLHRLDFSGLDPRLSACRFRLLCDVDSPLCGPDGASLTFGPQKGASPETASRLDKALEHFARVVREQLGVDMLPWRGGGAAGGLGAALRLAGNASMTPGIDALLDAAGFEDRLAGCRLVITGEGRMDGQTARGKVPAGIARRAKAAANLPVAALTRRSGPRCPRSVCLRHRRRVSHPRRAHDPAGVHGRLPPVTHRRGGAIGPPPARLRFHIKRPCPEEFCFWTGPFSSFLSPFPCAPLY